MQISKQKFLYQNKIQEEELEKYKKKFLKTKGKTEDVKTELDEEERKQKDLALILRYKQNIKRAYAEKNGENNFASLIKEKLDAESALEEAKMMNIVLNNEIKSQEIRNKIEEIENEHRVIYGKNIAVLNYRSSIKSLTFI